MHFKRFYYLILVILASAAVSLRAEASPYPGLPNKPIVAYADSIANNVFIKVVSTKKNVRVGEPFMVKYTLYTAISVIDPETNVNVKFNNCYQEEFSNDTSTAIETVNGKRYNTVALKQYLVIANNPGVTVLPPIKIQLKMYATDTGFFQEQKLMTTDIFSETGSVMVEKLPTNPDSTLFTGAVGKFRLRAAYTQATRAKTMLLFHLTIEGIGNTKSAAITLPHFPEGLEVFNANTTRHDSVTNFGIITRFDYTFQVVANYRGKYDVPPVLFNVYDPERNKFISFTASTYSWQVDKGPQMIVDTRNPHKQANLLYFDTNLYAGTNQLFSYSGWYYILLLLAVLLSVYSFTTEYFDNLMLIWFGFIDTKMNKYRAIRSIQKLIEDASTLEEDVFWKRLTSILYRYIKGEAKLPNKSNSDLSFDATVLSKNVPVDIYQQVLSFLSNLQRIRFSAQRTHAVDKVQSCNQLITIVNALDTNWHE